MNDALDEMTLRAGVAKGARGAARISNRVDSIVEIVRPDG